MTIQQFKKLKKQIDLLISEVEKEVLMEGADIGSEEFADLILLVKGKLLEKFGLTLEQYQTLEAELKKKKPISFKDLTDIPEPFKIPTTEEIKELAKSVIPEFPAPKIIKKTEIVKEIVREKPIYTTIEKTDKAVKKDLLALQSDYSEFRKKTAEELSEFSMAGKKSLQDKIGRAHV